VQFDSRSYVVPVSAMGMWLAGIVIGYSFSVGFDKFSEIYELCSVGCVLYYCSGYLFSIRVLSFLFLNRVLATLND
jgi:hypothetical protein